MTPTQRTLQALRALGHQVDIAERWLPQARVRRDIFGFVDLIYLDAVIVAVQCTSTSNVAARVKKILGECREPSLAWLRAGGRIEVWGWRKYAKAVQRKVWRETRVEIVEEMY